MGRVQPLTTFYPDSLQKRKEKAMSDKIRTTTYLPEALYEKLRKEAYETKTSQAEIIEKALEKYFEQKPKKAGD